MDAKPIMGIRSNEKIDLIKIEKQNQSLGHVITSVRFWDGTREAGKSFGKKGCSSGFVNLPACNIPGHVSNKAEVRSNNRTHCPGFTKFTFGNNTWIKKHKHPGHI